MEPVVPLISSSSTGPLGIKHLPRLWLKILLHACGRLPEGYRHGEGGFDELICVRLGIDAAALIAYIENEKPDYLVFESWVSEHAQDLSPRTVNTLNYMITNGAMREEMAAERRERFGITDPAMANGVILNDLDDWASLHAAVAPVRAPAG